MSHRENTKTLYKHAMLYSVVFAWAERKRDGDRYGKLLLNSNNRKSETEQKNQRNDGKREKHDTKISSKNR